MKIFKKIFATLASIGMIVMPVVSAGMVSAVTTAPTSVTITQEVLKVTNPVTNTFTYTVTEDANNPETGLISAAKNNNTFTIAFNNEVPDSATNKATKTGTLDLSAINFTKVGDYKFKIEMTESSDTDNSYSLDTDYWYAYVSVRYVMEPTDSDEKTGTPTSAVRAVTATVGTENTDAWINPDPTATPAVAGNKDDITFQSTPGLTYVELTKKVTGNLGDINEYFEYTVDFGTTMASKKVTVLGAHAEGTGCATIVAASDEHTLDATGKTTLCLKHNQTVKIGLTAETNGMAQISTKINKTTALSYTITETLKAADPFNPQAEYKVFIDGATVASTTGSVTKEIKPLPIDPSNATAADTIAFNTNNKTTFNNNKESDVITGIFVNYWPFMLLIALGMIGVYSMKKTSKRK